MERYAISSSVNFAALIATDRPRSGAKTMTLMTMFSLAGFTKPNLNMLVKRFVLWMGGRV
jgi:hypothetical protein